MIFDAVFFTANSIFPVQQAGVQNFVDMKIYPLLTQWEFSICAMADFATSIQKIKSHVVESQMMSLVWPWLSLTEKQRTINHMIIFNDSVSKFYHCCQQLHERTVENFNCKYQFQYLASLQHNNVEKQYLISLNLKKISSYINKVEVQFTKFNLK